MAPTMKEAKARMASGRERSKVAATKRFPQRQPMARHVNSDATFSTLVCVRRRRCSNVAPMIAFPMPCGTDVTVEGSENREPGVANKGFIDPHWWDADIFSISY